MKKLFILLVVLTAFSCNSSFYKATFRNKNVYKTKSNLTVKKVYKNNSPSIDQREFTIVPNQVFPLITKTTFSITEYYIRYKVLSEEGDNKYIKLLRGCIFDGIYPIDTSIIFNKTNAIPNDKPENYVFQVSKKSLVPNTHYLASSALIGKIITLPLRVRNECWNDNNKVLQGTLSIGYGFGWKLKIGNNPYKSHYLSTILYAAGVSGQKYFSIAGKYTATNKDSLSAKTDEFAVTYLSSGLAYEYDRFNVGVFVGKDKMFGNLKNWVYQDKWWWGIGLGYELFK